MKDFWAFSEETKMGEKKKKRSRNYKNFVVEEKILKFQTILKIFLNEVT